VVAVREGDLGAGDRLDAPGLRRAREIHGAGEVVVVGQGERGITEVARL
jgi:hypothetical protein